MSRSIEVLEQEVAMVAPNYYSKLPYHNYEGHVSESLSYFDLLCDELEENDVSINRPLGRIALHLHDANFHVDHTLEGFDTKEQYSAHIARVILENLEARDDDISQVEAAIIATTASEVPVTNLDKAVRYADVGNVYGRNYPEFVRNFALLTKEAVVLKRPVADSFTAQREKSLAFLQQYVAPMHFESNGGDLITLPTNMNFAERNFAKLSRATFSGVVKLVPGVKELVPDSWAA